MYSAEILLTQGVDERRVGMRRWRRERYLTERAMAHMLECSTDTIRRIELGLPVSKESIASYLAFVARWEKVPEVQEQVRAAAEAIRSRYSTAARARNRKRYGKDPTT